MGLAEYIWLGMMGYLAFGWTINYVVNRNQSTGSDLLIIFGWPEWLIFKAVQTGCRRLFA